MIQKLAPADGADPARLSAWPPGGHALPAGWRAPFEQFLASSAGQGLSAALQARLAAGATIYPPDPLRALRLTPPEAVRVVVVGQDPYHGPGQANGLAFDVAPGVRTPPSLRNIHKELAREYGRAPQAAGLLEHWAAQGVLLLNTTLTVEHGAAASHSRLGWQAFTSALFNGLVESERPLVFMLWGAHAQALRPRTVAAERHRWLLANHPSPLSALRPPVPFIGCDHFRLANDFLRQRGEPSIDWLGWAA